MVYYLSDGKNWEKFTLSDDPSDLDTLKQMAISRGADVFTEKEFQTAYGLPSANLRAQGKELSDLEKAYREDPSANLEKMIAAGFDPRTADESGLGLIASFAPATEFASKSGMGAGGIAGGALIDMASNVLGGRAGGEVAKQVIKRGGGTAAKMLLPTGVDVATNAVAGGVQRGYGQGGFDLGAAMMGGGVAGGLGATGAAMKALGPQGFKALSSELSGVAPEALEQFARGGQGRFDIQNAKTAEEMSNTILNQLDHIDDLMPESRQVAAALEGKQIDIYPTISALQNAMDGMNIGGVQTPIQKEAYDKLFTWYQSLMEMPQFIPANEARQLRSQIDQAINYADRSIGQGVTAQVEKGFASATNKLRQDLKDVAGHEYSDLMESWSNKLNAAKELKNNLGSTAAARAKNTEGKVDNLFNRNKSDQQRIFNQFDDIFGTGFTKDIRNTAYAKKLGTDINMQIPPAERQPAWASRHMTGKSNTGLLLAGLGSGAGGLGISPVLAPMLPAALSAWSPRAATAVLGEMYNPSKVAQMGEAMLKETKNIARGKTTEKKGKK